MAISPSPFLFSVPWTRSSARHFAALFSKFPDVGQFLSTAGPDRVILAKFRGLIFSRIPHLHSVAKDRTSERGAANFDLAALIARCFCRASFYEVRWRAGSIFAHFAQFLLAPRAFCCGKCLAHVFRCLAEDLIASRQHSVVFSLI